MIIFVHKRANLNSPTPIYELQDSHIRRLHELYQEEWWTTGRSLEQTKQLVRNSDIVIGLVDGENQLIGFCRILTDRVIKAIIFDVIVAERYRNQKLGDLLMQLILDHDELQEVKHFELYCLEELLRFYERYEFKSLNDEMYYLRRPNPA